MTTFKRASGLAGLAAVVLLLHATSSFAINVERNPRSEHLDFPLRGQHLTLTIYRPWSSQAKAKGTIVMSSGDVGWVGLATTMAAFEAEDGYLVVGVNVREYLSTFTTRNGGHLLATDVPADFSRLADFLRTRRLLPEPVIVSGVSEGAGLSVLAASAPANHSWIHGVITMGLPATAELAWRWSDITSWITKKDSGEPSFAAKDFLPAVSPVPLYMIQSTRDEYVTEREYRVLEASARPPKKLALIDSANHRFTDRIAELRTQYASALAWIQTNADKGVPSADLDETGSAGRPAPWTPQNPPHFCHNFGKVDLVSDLHRHKLA